MKYLFFLLFTAYTSFFLTTNAQTKEGALRDAKLTAEATVKSDFETTLKYTPKAIVDLMGGKESALNMIEKSFQSMASQNISIESVEILDVSDVVKEQDQFRCLVKGENRIKAPTQYAISTSYLLGIYDENNNHWTFIEADKIKNKAVMEQIFPGFKTQFNIPENSMRYEAIKE